ncbi:MAG: type 1 glutamine amidotransferase domain-containing protein [Sphingobacteriia bacterium]
MLLSSIGFAQGVKEVVGTQAGHSAEHPPKGKILMIAANPGVSKQTGWPIGCWASELTHPYYEFEKAGYQIDIASPAGGKLEFDAYSNPTHESGYSAHDYLTLGFMQSPARMKQLENSLKLAEVDLQAYDAYFFVGGQSPMYTFRGNAEVLKGLTHMYDSGKPTALVCHSTCLLLDAKQRNGKRIVEGKTWTGFADSEEQYADSFVGQRIQPFWIETEARKLPNTTFKVQPAFTPYAIQDGTLITGQQQNSGPAAAQLVLQQLEKKK